MTYMCIDIMIMYVSSLCQMQKFFSSLAFSSESHKHKDYQQQTFEDLKGTDCVYRFQIWCFTKQLGSHSFKRKADFPEIRHFPGPPWAGEHWKKAVFLRILRPCAEATRLINLYQNWRDESECCFFTCKSDQFGLKRGSTVGHWGSNMCYQNVLRVVCFMVRRPRVKHWKQSQKNVVVVWLPTLTSRVSEWSLCLWVKSHFRHDMAESRAQVCSILFQIEGVWLILLFVEIF